MRKTKGVLLYMFLTLFIFSFAYITATIVIPNAFAVYSPYEQDQGLTLSVVYEDETLKLNTTGGTGTYEYQYWLLDKVQTDIAEGNKVTQQYIWQLIRGYGGAVCNVTKAEGAVNFPGIFLSDNEVFNIVVRVKDTATGEIIDELYGAYAPADIGKPVIESASVNGRAVFDDYIVVSRADLLNIEIKANLAGLNYSVLKGNTALADNVNAGQSKGVQISNIDVGTQFSKAGQYVLTLKAENGNTATKQIKLYVVDDYVATEQPVIGSLEPVNQDGSVATFNMYVTYADGSKIKSADIDDFVYSLVSGNADLNSTDVNDNDYIDYVVSGEGENEVLDYVEFTVDYGAGKYGIYETVATVARNSISGVDDKAIIYYNGYATREITGFNQTAESLGYNEETGAYTAGQQIRITPSGSITGATGDVKFAFYREDASGWVLIRSYKTLAEAPYFGWTPTRNGTYNIQVRMMDSAAGSYEAVLSKTYVVGDEELSGELDIKIYEYGTDTEANVLIAGNVYKLDALYFEQEVEGKPVRLDNVLYMFTLTSDNLSTIYLNKFNASPYYMFIPGRADSYKITARVIKQTSFGYKDISLTEDFKVYVQVELPQAEDTYPETVTNYADVFTGEGTISVEQVSGETASFSIDQNAKTVTYGGVGEYVVTFTTDSKIYVLPQTVTNIIYNSFDFEDEAQLSAFESVNPPEHDMHVGLSLVSYTDIGMQAPAGCGEKLLKLVTTHGNEYMPFYIHNGFVVPVGTTISFRIYKPGTKTQGFKIAYEDVRVPSDIYYSEGQWHNFTFTTPVASDSKFGDDIYFYIRNYDLVAGAAYYIDNFTISDPPPQYNSFDFEDEAQLSAFESVNPPEHDMHVGLSLVSYTDIGMQAPAGCGEKLLKLVTTHGNGYMPFYIHNGFVVPQGATISFRIYKPGTKTNGFKISYEDIRVPSDIYYSEGQWHDFTFTTPVASDSKFGYDIYLYIRNYDLVAGATYYIDNFTITMPN
jgi:DNA-binding transcriptional regulator YiaG